MQDEGEAEEASNGSHRRRVPVVSGRSEWFQVGFSRRRGRRDRRKLTFYFIAEKRIDFRELVRELFRYVSDLPRFGACPDDLLRRVFKTRIWLSALSSSGNYEQ